MSSCTQFYYIPNVHNVPLFKEKNEYRINPSLALGNASLSIELQAAYSITKNISSMANFMSTTNTLEAGVNRMNYFDVALGYYHPVKKQGVFEVYGGFGGGKQQHEYFFETKKGDITYNKIFMQPSFGFPLSKGFDIAFSSRLCLLNFTKNTIVLNAGSDKNELDKIIEHPNIGLFEPAITIRGGGKYIKGQLQYAFSRALSQRSYAFEQQHFSLGIYIAISGKAKISSN